MCCLVGHPTERGFCPLAGEVHCYDMRHLHRTDDWKTDFFMDQSREAPRSKSLVVDGKRYSDMPLTARWSVPSPCDVAQENLSMRP